MVFSEKELKNMAYRSANLGMLPRQDFILDEKKIINGYKNKKYGLNERIGELGESLSEHIHKMEVVKGQLSKEVVALNKAKGASIEQEIAETKAHINHQKTNIKSHIRRCQLNGDLLLPRYNVDEIIDADDFEPLKAATEKAEKKPKEKRFPFWLLYVIEVLFIFGEGVLFYNILTETHDLPEIILRSIFFIPIVFAASFLTSRRISLRWAWLPVLLILSVYATLTFTVMEWFFESQALDETLTFTGFFVKNGFLILGAVMMVTLALFLTNAVKSIYGHKAKKKPKKEKNVEQAVPKSGDLSPQQMDLDLKFDELKGSYKRLRKLENKLFDSHAAGKNDFKRILGDVSVLEAKAAEISEQIGSCEKEMSALELASFEEINKYREHFENYSDNESVSWKDFDFMEI